MRYVGGSIQNRINEQSRMPAPEVGMGATRMGWTDRHPYTIVEVVSPTRIVVQEDDAKRTDDNGMSESQSYEFIPNPEGRKAVLSRRRNGAWVEVGESSRGGIAYAIGHRSKYYDYSF